MDKLFRTLAGLIEARANCAHSGNTEWRERHEDRLRAIVKDRMPSGGGFDSGTKIDVDRSTGERLVFITAFHHMDENGGYVGWSEHEVVVTPSLHHWIRIRITGRDRRDIKDYIHEVFHTALCDDIDPAAEHQRHEAARGRALA
jgi:hypothetical protein